MIFLLCKFVVSHDFMSSSSLFLVFNLLFCSFASHHPWCIIILFNILVQQSLNIIFIISIIVILNEVDMQKIFVQIAAI